jgi:undecaprenyl-diphosphatase
MSIFQAMFLGIIQGITEFLPISSSGHLILIPKFFGWSDQGIAFDVIVHLGSLLAVVVYFRKKLQSIILGVFDRGVNSALNKKLGIFIVLSIIPAGIFGLSCKDWIEENLRDINVVAYGLIFWGIVLLLADIVNKKWTKEGKQLSDINNLSFRQIMVVAFAQAIALIPGTSRSGITMTAGLFSKFDKKTAAEFSFLMSVPIIALAGGLKIIDLIQYGLGNLSISILIVGFISAAISGFFAISGLMKIVTKWGYSVFVWYRVLLGIYLILNF